MQIKLSGLDATIQKMENLTKDTEVKVQKALNAFGLRVEGTARKLAPSNESNLRRSINMKSLPLGVSIVAATNYAAYIEFGTRKFAAQYVSSLPTEWSSYAATFKGKTDGNFDDFLESIYEWVRKKQIGATYNIQTRRRDRVGRQSAETTDRATAYFIAMHILRHGIRPQPFMYPAVNEHTKQLIADIKAVFK